MAVDEGDRQRDLYDARLGPHDRRTTLDGWVYYVRVVRHERDLRRPPFHPAGELLVDGVRLLGRGLDRLRHRGRPRVVGVVRLGDVATWRDLEPVVVHAVALDPGRPVPDQVDDLVDRARGGAFAPGREP